MALSDHTIPAFFTWKAFESAPLKAQLVIHWLTSVRSAWCVQQYELQMVAIAWVFVSYILPQTLPRDKFINKTNFTSFDLWDREVTVTMTIFWLDG